MDIKTKIDELSEAEAKAALSYCLEMIVMYQTAAWTKVPDTDGLKKLVLCQAIRRRGNDRRRNDEKIRRGARVPG